MLKRKITSKILTIILVMLLFTSCAQSGDVLTPERSSQSNVAATRAPNAPMEPEIGKPDTSMTSDSLKYSTPIDGATGVVEGQEFNTEEYGKINERGFVSPLSNPLSTFSIDVDTASYANARRYLNSGEKVPQDAVRIEEMINYFKYDYPKPDGDVPFSVYTEISACPWKKDHQLLLIGLQGKEIDISDIPSSNLVFLVDVSGSMQDPNKLPLVKQALLMLVENLRPNDRISIVTYAGSDSVVLSGVSGENKLEITDAIQNLEAGGSTAGARGIETAYKIAKKNFIKEGNNRVILTTDGDFNVGVSSEGELTRLIEKKRKEGVYLSVIGFGEGNIKDNKMEALADNGNGNYSYIDSVLEAKKVLVEEMGGTLLTIAKDVKLQVEFNPAKVEGYRLVGYENRMLNDEDFEDDTKDAGEMGAGHRVTALYEIIPVGSEEKVGGNNLKYQDTQSTGSNEWLNIDIRYKNPDQDKSQLLTFAVDETYEKKVMSDNFAFASAVAEFGLLLRDSEYKGDSSFESVYGRAVNLPSVKEDAYKVEFLGMVEKLMK